MMEMDGLDNAKCQKSRRSDMMGIVDEEKTKDEHCSSSSIKRPKKKKNVKGWKT